LNQSPLAFALRSSRPRSEKSHPGSGARFHAIKSRWHFLHAQNTSRFVAQMLIFKVNEW
jgi:hypothetical protein